MQATVHVYTFREGLLGKLGHDLRFTLTRFRVVARGRQITAHFDPRSLQVDGAVREGRVEERELSPSDRQKIHEGLAEDVLRVREYGDAMLSARTTANAPPFDVEGQLTLCGVTLPISFKLVDVHGRLHGTLELKPSRWGIKPYRALGGALKVQDRVVITIDANADWLRLGGELNPAVELAFTPSEEARGSSGAAPRRSSESQRNRPR